MSGYVVDASVAVKWLVTEAFSEQAARLLDGEQTLRGLSRNVGADRRNDARE